MRIFIVCFVVFYSLNTQAQIGKILNKTKKKIETEKSDTNNTSQIKPEDKAKAALDRAEDYLMTDPCNNTGLGWVDKALSYESDNKEALNYISKCQEIKYQKAMDILDKNPLDKKAINTLTELSKLKKYSTERVHFLIANYNIESGRPLNNVKEDITISINYNPQNNDYRWIRVRSNMTTMSGIDDLKQAIDDMKFMIDNGANTTTVNMHLGLAYTELGNKIRYGSRPSPSTTYKDKDVEYENSLRTYYKNIISNYSKAILSYKNAVKIDTEVKIEHKIKTLENDISELEIESGI